MPRRKAETAAPVEIRFTSPEPAADVDESTMLYRAVQQAPDPKKFKTEWAMLTPEKMAGMLEKADADEQFRQRPVTTAGLERWRKLVESNRFVHYLPNGPLCYDEAGALLNGKHRLTAGAICDKPLGFMIVRNVPRWMFRYFDTPKLQTLSDVLIREGRGSSRLQGQATLSLALRYEEFLHGLRPAGGWRNWSARHDEHTDLEDLFYRREPLMDLQPSASQAQRGKGAPGSWLIVTSLMVFRFYQQLAWPAGADKLDEFWEGLTTGAMLPLGHPAKTLREWGYDSHEGRETWPARRETHLLLLFNMFAAAMRGEQVRHIRWAYGFPMPAPYHPRGAATAVKTALAALSEMDRETAI